MVKKIITKFAVAKKQGGSGGTIYRSPRIYLPTRLTDDSRFPFQEGDILSIRVDGRRLVVQRASRARIGDDTILKGVRSHNMHSKVVAQ